MHSEKQYNNCWPTDRVQVASIISDTANNLHSFLFSVAYCCAKRVIFSSHILSIDANTLHVVFTHTYTLKLFRWQIIVLQWWYIGETHSQPSWCIWSSRRELKELGERDRFFIIVTFAILQMKFGPPQPSLYLQAKRRLDCNHYCIPNSNPNSVWITYYCIGIIYYIYEQKRDNLYNV
jgi:hypothetical protein